MHSFNHDGGTPLHAAVNIDYTSANLDDDPALLEELQGRKCEIVQMLLAHGANPNAPDAEGDTPLHFAACDNQCKIARVLLEAGANVGARTDHASTPIELAQGNGHTECVALLSRDEWTSLQHRCRVVLRTAFSAHDIAALPQLPLHYKQYLGVVTHPTTTNTPQQVIPHHLHAIQSATQPTTLNNNNNTPHSTTNTSSSSSSSSTTSALPNSALSLDKIAAAAAAAAQSAFADSRSTSHCD